MVAETRELLLKSGARPFYQDDHHSLHHIAAHRDKSSASPRTFTLANIGLRNLDISRVIMKEAFSQSSF
jgi:hypothetical protein